MAASAASISEVAHSSGLCRRRAAGCGGASSVSGVGVRILLQTFSAIHDPRRDYITWVPRIRLAFARAGLGTLFRSSVRFVRVLPGAASGIRRPFRPTACGTSSSLRETWVLIGYFGLLVLFCSANQYSWLQPLTGFRYLVPVVPALALLALQTSQILPGGVRWLIAGATLIQALIISAVHENDVRQSFLRYGIRGFNSSGQPASGKAVFLLCG